MMDGFRSVKFITRYSSDQGSFNYPSKKRVLGKGMDGLILVPYQNARNMAKRQKDLARHGMKNNTKHVRITA